MRSHNFHLEQNSDHADEFSDIRVTAGWEEETSDRSSKNREKEVAY